MKIIVGDLLTIEEEKFITMDVITYDGVDYAFVNKMTDDEEPTETFYVFEIIDDEVELVEDKEILDQVLPIFSKNVQKIIDKINQ